MNMNDRDLSVVDSHLTHGHVICQLSNSGHKVIRPRYDESVLLHVLFPPCTNSDLVAIEETFGFSLHPSYSTFMRYANGASLFESSVVVFGVVHQFGRGESIDELNPVSLLEKVDLFRALHPASHRVPVGSVPAYQKTFQLLLDVSGTTSIIDPVSGQERSFSTFLKALEAVICIDDVLYQSRKPMLARSRELETELEQLIGTKN